MKSSLFIPVLLLAFVPFTGFATPASLDATFGAGTVTTSFRGYGDNGQAVAVQSDSKIVVAGSAGNNAGGIDFAVLRYNANGTLDTGFNGTGKVTTAFVAGSQSVSSGAGAVAVQSDGKVIAAGGANGNIALVRYNTDGSLDTSFNGTGQVTTIYGSEGSDALAVALQADGKIVVAGSYYATLNDTAFIVARYNTNGSLDTTFNGTGIVTKNFGGGYDQATSVAVQSDGRIVVAGTMQVTAGQYAFATLRYNTNGSPDTTFNGTGAVTTTINTGSNQAQSVRLQTDGKILVGGTAPGSAYSLDFALVRYNANGSLDTTFNGTGKVTVNFAVNNGYGSLDSGSALAVQGDGKILLGGSTNAPLVTGNQSFGLVRLNTNGSLDTTFNGTGLVTTAVGSGTSHGYAAAISGTKIIVAGTAFDGAHNTFAAASYTANGTLDPTFNALGKVATAVGLGDDSANAVAIAADGKILLAGSDFNGSNDDFALVRYNANGTRDTTFNGSGEVVTDFGGYDDLGNGVALQKDGKILVAGTSSNGSNDDFAVARYNTDGSLDTAFHATGTVTTDLSGADDEGAGVAVQSDGKIVVAGTAHSGSRNVFAVVRYNPDGSLDTTFAGTGKVLTSIGSGNSFGKGLALQTDGKILVAGYAFGTSNYDFALVRYNTNGSLDTSFIAQGKDTTAIGHRDDLGQSVAVQPDGKILVAGVSYTDTIFVSTLVRYNTNGSLDVSFNPNGHTGTISVAVGPRDYTGSSLALQPDGKIVLAGTASNGSASQIAVQRYTSTGVPDTDFNGNGQVLTAFNSAAFGNGVALQSNGNIVVGGATSIGANDDFAAVRYVGGQ